MEKSEGRLKVGDSGVSPKGEEGREGGREGGSKGGGRRSLYFGCSNGTYARHSGGGGLCVVTSEADSLGVENKGEDFFPPF